MKRSPGRPRLDDDDESTQVGVRLPTKQYDDLCKRAQEERVTVSEIIRRDLRDKHNRD